MIPPSHRFRGNRRCPICGGADQDPRGAGRRCAGYLSTDGAYAHCSREEHAGTIAPHASTGLYPHRLAGTCACGGVHDPAGAAAVPTTPGPAGAEPAVRPAPDPRPGEVVYVYRDEHGAPLFRVVRTPDKRFFQHARDERSPTGWSQGLGEARRVIYRLPELLAAPGAPVFVCEGEKDAEHVARLGLVATSGPMGAGKWRLVEGEAAAALLDRDVVILPDRDAPGRAHAEDVARRLLPHARSVRIVELPLPHGARHKDAADWIALGGTHDQLLELAARAVPLPADSPAWAPPRDHAPPPAHLDAPPPGDEDAPPPRDLPASESSTPAAAAPAPAAAPWTPPRPLPEQALPPVPRFDATLLPRGLRAWVLDTAQRMDVAPDIPAIAAMVALSIVVANARTIRPKRRDTSWRVHPVLWGLVVAPPGAKKSPSIAPAERLLGHLERLERERFEGEAYARKVDEELAQARIEGAKARLARRAKAGETIGVEERAEVAAMLRAEADAAEERRARRVISSDPTIEALTDVVRRGTRRAAPVVVWCDEVMALLGAFEREGRESDRAFYLKGWSVADHRVDRVKRGSTYVRDLAVAVFGGVQPGPLRRYVRETIGASESSDGFLQRFQLAVYPDAPPEATYTDEPPDHEAERAARALFEELWRIDDDDETGRPPALDFDEIAQAIHDEWARKLEHRLRDPSLPAERVSHLAKYRSLMPALALVWHCATGAGSRDQPVTDTAARVAIDWCTYLDAHAARIYALADDSRSVVEQIARAIELGKASGRMTRDELRRRVGLHRKGDAAEDIADAVEELEALGWLRTSVHRPATRGRPSFLVEINPLARRVQTSESSAPSTETSAENGARETP
jgi:putative DNA primase/helicase